MWTKHVGATLDRVTFAKENDTREWMLQGSVEGLKFEMTIMCATDVIVAFHCFLIHVNLS